MATEALTELFSGDFMPHGVCLLWRPGLLMLHAISDLVIALAYISIPLSLSYILYRRKRKLPFYWITFLFVAFIFLCGMTHLLELFSLWRPYYYLEGLLKLITAAVSIATALIMFPLVPAILAKFEQLEEYENMKNSSMTEASHKDPYLD
ncbi:MAG: hypothetical protein AB7E85_03625 [Pseudobdellovibrionaceae bacterium]